MARTDDMGKAARRLARARTLRRPVDRGPAKQLRIEELPLDRPVVLVVGLNQRTLEWLQTPRSRPDDAMVAVLVDSETTADAPADDLSCLSWLWRHRVPIGGTTAMLPDLLRAHSIEEVVVTLPVATEKQHEQIRQVVEICEEAGVPVTISSPLFDRVNARPIVRREGDGRYALSFDRADRHPLERATKRTMDIAGALLALSVFALPMLVIAILIKITSPRGPVFFVQERCGLRHRRFRMLKFRTMVPNAETMRVELAAQNEMDGPVFKIRNDPRVTPVGRILRKLSLDELPQLFNVLRGDMSLVGPRPPLPSEVAEYEPWMRRRLTVPPGLTCTWQVSGRNGISFEQWMRMDLEYIDTWSIWRDIALLLRTIPAVLSTRGAS
ncbi:MAG TPA: sugar transferase [Planctomycetota bacterium]|nr:sugar transferase [Planctomycetota bacterium]